jgi:hypothetical protein
MAGYRRTGYGTVGLFGVALLMFVIWFGQPLGWAAVTVIIALHSIALGVWLGRMVPQGRLIAVPVAFVVLMAGLYWPLEQGLSRLVLPVQTVDGVVIVNRLVPSTLQRGDLVAFRIAASTDRSQVRTRAGIGLERILAGPGETVRFSEDEFAIGKETWPRRDYMPKSGEIHLGPDQWFVWPTFQVRNHRVDEAGVAAVFLEHSVIPRSELLGVPCKRWFWRKAQLP